MCCFCTVLSISCKDDGKIEPSPENIDLKNIPEEYTKPMAFWGFIDTLGNVAIQPQFDEVRPFTHGIAVVNIHGKWGAINHKGTMVIPPHYAALTDFKDNLALATTFEGKKYFIDTSNRKVLDCPYTDCMPFKGKYCVVQDNEFFGLMDNRGEIRLNPQYLQLKADENYLITTEIDGFSSLLRISDMRLMFKVEGQIFLPTEGIFRYSEENDVYYRHVSGKAVAGPFEAGAELKDGYTSVRDQGKVFILLASGKQIETTCTQLQYAGSNLWFCRHQDKRYSLIKIDDQAVIPQGNIKCSSFTRFSDGLAGCMDLKGAWGYIDTLGQVVIKNELPLAWDAKEGRIRISGLVGYGYLDRYGKEIIPMQFFEARDFYEGKAAFQEFPD